MLRRNDTASVSAISSTISSRTGQKSKRSVYRCWAQHHLHRLDAFAYPTRHKLHRHSRVGPRSFAPRLNQNARRWVFVTGWDHFQVDLPWQLLVDNRERTSRKTEHAQSLLANARPSGGWMLFALLAGIPVVACRVLLRQKPSFLPKLSQQSWVAK